LLLNQFFLVLLGYWFTLSDATNAIATTSPYRGVVNVQNAIISHKNIKYYLTDNK